MDGFRGQGSRPTVSFSFKTSPKCYPSPPPTSPQVEKILPSHWIFPTPILFLNGRGTWRAFKITNLKVNFSILMKRDQIHLRSELCPILCALAIEMFTQRPFRDFSASLLHFDRIIFVIDVYCNFI